MAYLMTIDAGTGSVRAVIFDQEGRQISVGQREWVHKAEVGVTNSMSFAYVKYWTILGVFSAMAMIAIFILIIYKP